MHEVVVAVDREAVARLAAEFIARIAERSRGSVFNLALSGGSTPMVLYRTLAEEPYLGAIPWDSTHIWWGDERAVGPDDPSSNYLMAKKSLLSSVPVPEEQIHRIKGELGAKDAATQYRQELIDHLGPKPRFSLIIMGVGPDGHTASIFPKYVGKLPADELVAVTRGGIPDVDRVTVTFDVINASDQIAVLVKGADKADIMQRVLMGDPTLPASHISPIAGEERLHYFLDSAAAEELGRDGR